MKVSASLLVLLAAVLVPGANANLLLKFKLKKMFLTFYPHHGWDSWTWWDFFHHTDKVCNKLTQDFVDCGAVCRCGKSFDLHRGGFGYRYSCILPKPINDPFCIASNCGNYQITRTIFPKGVNVEECAVPAAPGISLTDTASASITEGEDTSVDNSEAFLWFGWDKKWQAKEEKYDHWEDKFNDKLDNLDHWNYPDPTGEVLPPPPFGRSCATYMTDVVEVVDCEFELNGQMCQTCGIGRYGPTADCSNVLGFTDFTGFQVEPVTLTPAPGGSVTVDEEEFI